MKLFTSFIALFVVLLNCLALVSSLSFTLPPGQKKCLKEEVHKDVLVTGDYKLSDAAHQKTHLTVSNYDFYKLCVFLSDGLLYRAFVDLKW